MVLEPELSPHKRAEIVAFSGCYFSIRMIVQCDGKAVHICGHWGGKTGQQVAANVDIGLPLEETSQ